MVTDRAHFNDLWLLGEHTLMIYGHLKSVHTLMIYGY